MNAFTVKAHLVDGGLQEFTFGPELLQHLESLQKQGYTGKELIHRLITDDWGAPPVFVGISGTMSDGRAVDIRIPYR
jgi:hypothetical protein